MPIEPKGLTEGFDTRGLPLGFDPRNFYEYRFEQLRNNPASDLEWLLYKYIPHALIKSFALAIDPLYQFKVSPGLITPGNRTRKRAVSYIGNKRRIVYTTRNTSFSQEVNFQGVGGCRSRGLSADTPYIATNAFDINPQEPVVDECLDTTSRTRLIGSKQGTLKKFSAFAYSPPRSVARWDDFLTIPGADSAPSNDNCILKGGTYQHSGNGKQFTGREIVGPGAILSAYQYSQLRLSEYAYAESLISTHVLGMLKEWSPNKRGYTLFRNVVELRDIPRSISSLRESLGNFRSLYVSLAKSPSLRKIIFDLKGSAKAVPNEYLSFHFGWKQLYKDITDLLEQPKKFTKKMNFLIARNGKPTTYRSTKKFLSGYSGDSGFEHYPFNIEGNYRLGHNVQRESELRLVINATFDFPDVSGPSFRQREFLRQLGVFPTPTDLYNLVPWSWLIDWFSGLGNYVEMIDIINSDPTLVNWGMITCETKGELDTTLYSETSCSSSVTANGVTTTRNFQVPWRHTSKLSFECQIRKDVSTSLVRKTSDPTSLSAFQKSIIGALLAQRIDNSRSGTFRPKT